MSEIENRKRFAGLDNLVGAVSYSEVSVAQSSKHAATPVSLTGGRDCVPRSFAPTPEALRAKHKRHNNALLEPCLAVVQRKINSSKKPRLSELVLRSSGPSHANTLCAKVATLSSPPSNPAKPRLSETVVSHPSANPTKSNTAKSLMDGAMAKIDELRLKNAELNAVLEKLKSAKEYRKYISFEETVPAVRPLENQHPREVNEPVPGDLVMRCEPYTTKHGTWTRSFPYLVTNRVKRGVYMIVSLTKEHTPTSSETFNALEETWFYLKSNGPLGDEEVNLLKNFYVGAQVQASYPQYVDGEEDPIFEDASEGSEQFSPAEICKLVGDQALVHWNDNGLNFSAWVGVERLLAPIAKKASFSVSLKLEFERMDAKYKKDQLEKILALRPPNCRLHHKATVPDYEIRARRQGDMYVGKLTFYDKNRDKTVWVEWKSTFTWFLEDVWVKKPNAKKLHKTSLILCNKERLTMFLEDFKMNEGWSQFSGKGVEHVISGQPLTLKGGILKSEADEFIYINVFKCVLRSN